MSPKEVEERTRELASGIEEKLRVYAQNSKPLEKVPALVLSLTSGQDPLLRSSRWMDRVIERDLGYPTGSRQARGIRAYLSSVDEVERGWSLAYLVSQRGKGGSYKPIFEAFRTLGIKSGQLASLLNAFGDEAISRDLASLKDAAEPMDKAEILRLLKATLSSEEYARIEDVEEVLGAASIKTVAKVRLKGGREVVVWVRNPNARRQIESSYGRAKRFIAGLKAEGLLAENDPLTGLIDQAYGQVVAELDFTREAGKIEVMKKAYAESNRVLSEKHGGWKVEVPGLVDGFRAREEVVFVEMARGTSYNRVPRDVQADAMIAESTLDHYFRSGVINPDPHRGNFLVDMGSKTLEAIDFGQVVEFVVQPDPAARSDAYLFGQLVRAISEKNAKRALDYSIELNHLQLPETDPRRLALLRGVEGIFGPSGPKSVQEQVLAIIHQFGAHQLPFDPRYSTGVFKALMILAAEGYVASPAQISDRHVRGVLAAHLPATVLDEHRSMHGDVPCLPRHLEAIFPRLKGLSNPPLQSSD